MTAPPAWLCGTVAEATTDAALARLRAAAAVCGRLELRLDAAPPGALDLARLVAARPRPLVVTCRPRREGGAWPDDDEARRLALLAEAAALGAEAVDVEWDALDRLPALPGATTVVVSRHRFEPLAAATAAGAAALEPLLASLRHPRAAVRKLAVAVEGAEDALALLARAAGEDRPTIAVAMGLPGVVSRLLGPRWGAPWVYAAADPARPAAPGQLPAARVAALLAGRTPGPATGLLGVVGRPVAHSRSPDLFNRAFAALGLDAAYTWLETGAPAALLDALARDPGARGASVTLPHKQAALAWALARGGGASDAARACGAANTLTRGPGGWTADNTDARAALALLAPALTGPGGPGGPGAGAPPVVAVLGTGGAARAVAWAAARLGARVRLHGRDEARGRALAAELSAGMARAAGPAPAGAPPGVVVQASPVAYAGPLAALARAGAPDAPRVVAQATPIGMAPGAGAQGDASPVPADAVGAGQVAYELVYTPPETAFLRAARARGAGAISGLDHFLLQARLQLAAWVGDERAPPPEALGALLGA